MSLLTHASLKPLEQRFAPCNQGLAFLLIGCSSVWQCRRGRKREKAHHRCILTTHCSDRRKGHVGGDLQTSSAPPQTE